MRRSTRVRCRGDETVEVNGVACVVSLLSISVVAGTGAASIGTTARPSATIDTVAVMKPVHEFVASFNKGDATTTDAGCAHVTSIINDFPPHEWQAQARARAGCGAIETTLPRMDSPT